MCVPVYVCDRSSNHGLLMVASPGVADRGGFITQPFRFTCQHSLFQRRWSKSQQRQENRPETALGLHLNGLEYFPAKYISGRSSSVKRGICLGFATHHELRWTSSGDWENCINRQVKESAGPACQCRPVEGHPVVPVSTGCTAPDY